MGDPTGLLDQLKENYGVEEDVLYGQCIVVPEAKFHDDWSNALRELGCRITSGNRGLHPVIFVTLPEAAKEKPLTEAVAEPRKRGRPRKTRPGEEKPLSTPIPIPTAEPAPITRPFPELWDEAIKLGQDIEGLAEQVYNACVKAGMPQAVIEAFLAMFAEILGHVNWLTDNKVDPEQLNKTNILFRQHKHVDNQIYVPLEAQ